MKKLTSLLLVMAMLVAAIPAAFADPTVGAPATGETALDDALWSWYDKSKIPDDNGDPCNVPFSIGITSAEAFEGSNSMHMVWNDTSSTSKVGWPEVGIITKDAIPAGTYTFSMTVKSVGGANWLRIKHQQYSTNVALPYFCDAGNTSIAEKTGFGTAVTKEETNKTGWYKYSIDMTFTAATKLELYLNGKAQGGGTDIYVDNISLVDKTTAENALAGAVGTFEPAEEEPVIPDEKFNAEHWGVYGNTDDPDVVYSIGVSPGVAYEGERSLHMKWSDSGTDWPSVELQSLTKYPAGDYTFSVYAKNIGTVATFNVPDAKQSNGRLNIMNGSGVTSEATNKEGWSKQTMNITLPGDGVFKILMIGHYTDSEIYLDNMSLVKEGTSTNLLAEIGTFELAEEKPKNMIPDLTGASPNTDFWNKSDNGATEVLWETTMGEAYEGERSLHFRRANHAAYSNMWPKSAMLTVGAEYIMSAYIKINELSDGSTVKMAFYSWGGENITNEGKISKEATDKEGWYKYTFKAATKVESSNPGGPMIVISTGATGVADIYVDNISITDASGNPVASMGDEGTFEVATTETYEVSNVKLFEIAEDVATEVPAIGTAQSGKTLTAAVSILNRDADKALNAQLIVAVFKGEELEVIDIPDGISITKADGLTTLTGEIMLPTITADGEYSVKVFVWDSFENMMPLKKTVAEF